MKTLAGYAVAYAILFVYLASWLISLYVSRKSANRAKRWARISAGFLVPVIVIGVWTWWITFKLESDWKYFQQLCRTQAGDRIHRTVDGVAGIFQMRPREPNSSERYARTGVDDMAADQFGLEDPYGFALHDSPDRYEVFLARFNYADPNVPRYRFVETLRAHGAPNAPPYKRYQLVFTEKDTVRKGEASKKVETQERLVDRLEAFYGYTWEDLSTREMREKYIAGGRFTIKDLRTNEVLAERTGFVFARHRSGARPKYFWSNSDNRCPDGPGVPRWIDEFVFSVLRPAK